MSHLRYLLKISGTTIVFHLYRKLQNDKLYVYVYHKETIKDKETDLLIGVCEVDTTIFGTVDGMNIIEGYYRLFKNDSGSSSQDELGILKIKVVPSANIKKADLSELDAKKLSPRFGKEEDAEARTLQDVYETLKQIRGDAPEVENAPEVEDAEERKEMEEVEQFGEYDRKLQMMSEEISAEESATLIQRHMENLQALDLINKRLKGDFYGEEQVQKDYPDSELVIEAVQQKQPEHVEQVPMEDKVEHPEPEGKGEEYELEIKGDEINQRTEDAKKVDYPETAFDIEPLASPPQEKHVTNIFEHNLLNARQTNEVPHQVESHEGLAEENLGDVPATQTINRKKLLSTPHKKPPLPKHLSSSIKRMSGTDLKEKELDRITKIMRASPAREAKKYYDYSSDSDS